MPFPFEVGFDELQSDLNEYVDAVFACLESEFLVMPKGKGFVEFSTFESGYEALKRATGGFREFTPENIASVVFEVPISLVVLRCVLGCCFSQPAAKFSRCRTSINSSLIRALQTSAPGKACSRWLEVVRRAVCYAGRWKSWTIVGSRTWM